MSLFASRPLRTNFSESPGGWYLYRWEVAATPAYVEWREFGNFAFIAIHLLITLGLIWIVVRMVSRKSK